MYLQFVTKKRPPIGGRKVFLFGFGYFGLVWFLVWLFFKNIFKEVAYTLFYCTKRI